MAQRDGIWVSPLIPVGKIDLSSLDSPQRSDSSAFLISILLNGCICSLFLFYVYVEAIPLRERKTDEIFERIFSRSIRQEARARAITYSVVHQSKNSHTRSKTKFTIKIDDDLIARRR